MSALGDAPMGRCIADTLAYPQPSRILSGVAQRVLRRIRFSMYGLHVFNRKADVKKKIQQRFLMSHFDATPWEFFWKACVLYAPMDIDMPCLWLFSYLLILCFYWSRPVHSCSVFVTTRHTPQQSSSGCMHLTVPRCISTHTPASMGICSGAKSEIRGVEHAWKTTNYFLFWKCCART